MAKQTFTTGQVLTSAQMTSLQQTAMGGGSATAKTASYTLVAADAGATVIMNSASATTITVNTGLFVAGDTVFIQNIGVGISTITAGTATVSTASSLALAQYESGNLYFTAAGTSIFAKSDGVAAGGVTFAGTRLTKSAGQTISNNTDTMVTWNVENFDVGGYHDNSSNTSRITIPSDKAGYYQINVTLGYAANGTGQRVITLAKNGTNRAYNLNIIRAVNSGGYTSVFYSDIVYGAVADYFEISTFQDSGGDLSIIGNNGDPGACYFSFSFIGA